MAVAVKSSRAEHQQLPIAQRRSGQRGVAALWTIVSLPVLLTLLLVVIEAAHLFIARVELQSGLEAAALAGVKTWADISEATTPPDEHETPGLLAITNAARLAAQSTAANNTVSGQPILLGLNSLDDTNNVIGYDNEFCNGDILLGGFPSTGTTFTTTASVGCGRTMTGDSIMIDIEFHITVVTPGVMMGAQDTSNTPDAFRLSYTVLSISPPYMASDISLTQVQLYLRNGMIGSLQGVFNPSAGPPYTFTNSESGSGPNVHASSDVPSSDVSFSFSDNSPITDTFPNLPTRMTIDVTPGVWLEGDTLIFGVDTDGVRVGGGAVTATDQGGDFGQPGGAAVNPAKEVIFGFAFDTPIGTTALQNLNSLLQRTNAGGNSTANFQGAAENHYEFTTTIVVPNEEFAVLTQKTMNVSPLFTRLLGLPPIGAIPITGRAIAVARCRAIDDMDPIVLNPRAVYYTTIVCP